MRYVVFKGVGRTVEVLGLRGSNLTLFFILVSLTVVIVMVMGIVGAPMLVVLPFGVISVSIAAYMPFYLQKKHGLHGTMKLQAKKMHPTYIRNNIPVHKLITVVAKTS